MRLENGEVMKKIGSVYTYTYYSHFLQGTNKFLEDGLEAFSMAQTNLSFINQVAHCYYYINDYFNALDFVLKAHNLSEAQKKNDEYYYTLKLTGDIYRKLGINESSIYYYLEAMKRIGEVDQQRKRCDLLRHIGMVYTAIRTLDLATDYAVEALQIAELVQDKKLIGEANLSLCRLSAARKLYDKALKYGLKAVEMFKEVNATKGLVLIYLEIASIYEHSNDNNMSKSFYERALMLSAEIQYNSGVIFANLLLGKLLLKEGYNERAQYILEEALALSRKCNIQKHKIDLYYSLADLYADSKEYELAFNSYKTGTELKEYQQADMSKHKIFKLQNEYNLYMKEKELRQYVEQNESLEKINRQLSEEVKHDPLTGLLNRRGLKQAISDLSYDGRHMVVLCDIDGFKKINDEYGHPCGDALLKELAKVFKENIKGSHQVARWGGEEFLMVLTSTTKEKALEFSTSLLELIRNYEFPCGKRSINVTLTFGISPLYSEFETSIHLADERLYYGKNNGKNQIVVE